MTEIRTTSSTGAEKGIKPERYDLIPVEALAAVARLYGAGAKKYAAHNWRKGYEYSKSYAAMQRHANQFWNGEDVDEEMGESHLAAVIFHAMTLLTFQKEHPEFDDRFSSMIREAQSDDRSGLINILKPEATTEEEELEAWRKSQLPKIDEANLTFKYAVDTRHQESGPTTTEEIYRKTKYALASAGFVDPTEGDWGYKLRDFHPESGTVSVHYDGSAVMPEDILDVLIKLKSNSREDADAVIQQIKMGVKNLEELGKKFYRVQLWADNGEVDFSLFHHRTLGVFTSEETSKIVFPTSLIYKEG